MANLYDNVTEKIILAIEKGAKGFQMPWHQKSTLPHNPISKTKYLGMNTLILWSEAMSKGYPENVWATFSQWKEKGVMLKKGERGTSIIFYKRRDIEEEETPRFVMRSYLVWNEAQVEGHEPELRESLVFDEPRIEGFVTDTGARVVHGGDYAAYVVHSDYIRMPPKASFTGSSTCTPTEGYYSTLLHELVHWSGNETRLNRDLTGRFGQSAYAVEELVAELGSAFLSARLGFRLEPIPDNAAYIGSWLRLLREDNRAIFQAATRAKEAVKFLEKTT